MLLLAGSCYARPSPTKVLELDYHILAELPHRPGAFTQGLVFLDDEVLLEGTGQYGGSTLARLEWENKLGVASQISLPRKLFGEGITVFNGRIYQLTWRAGLCLIYNAETLQQTHQLRYDGEGWGLTNNTSQLIVSNGSELLSFHDPRTFIETHSIAVMHQGKPLKRLNELEWIAGLIWANVWYSNKIFVVHPETGQVLAELDLSALSAAQGPKADVLNGIAYNRARESLVVTGKYWDKVYEIQVPKPQIESLNRLR